MLKEECGAQFTTKLEGMFKDIELSRELSTRIRDDATYRALATGRIDEAEGEDQEREPAAGEETGEKAKKTEDDVIETEEEAMEENREGKSGRGRRSSSRARGSSKSPGKRDPRGKEKAKEKGPEGEEGHGKWGSGREGGRAQEPSIDLTTKVLTAAHWPSFAPIKMNLPRDMELVKNGFEVTYLKNFSGRRLLWILNQVGGSDLTRS